MEELQTERVVIKKVDLPNGETIAYRKRAGGEKKVLLIHGNMTSSKHWDLLIDAMDAEYKIFALDMRGFGESSYDVPVLSIKDFADDVRMFVDAIGLQGFAAIGWSTGGAVAMQFAADHPGYCDKLVLLASASTRGYPFYGTTAEGVPDLNDRYKSYEDIKGDQSRTAAIQSAYDTGNRDLLKAVWNTLIYTHNQPEPAHYEEYVDDMMTQRNLAEVYHSLNTFNISGAHNGLLKGTNQVQDIDIPVLVLRGERDLVITKEMADEIIEDFDGRARFVELKDCGHSPLVDDLDQLRNVITEFLG
ncbi:intracellular short-chain-length polyhydroxyalkanoate depolymerase [Bacillus sp. T33-2]|uniref:intracellular short-chain-length polyhydroxyalkanoate depolymerase n=1 Tax=Bacillus sp. T33-2 TaxID=2054168 RepID=UPI000C760634|nr:alpha/beta hydrolase [Bacillus sp. T33-2]PLR97679.1 alpha/beta hydrolase [Bacillus sp. T33-2]